MSKLTVADSAWLEFAIKEHLEPALAAAKQTASDLEHLQMCDAAGCGMMFDARDKRGMVMDGLSVCPACEFEYDPAKARAALAKAEAWEALHPGIVPLVNMLPGDRQEGAE